VPKMPKVANAKERKQKGEEHRSREHRARRNA
jgi:hypothetical protein